MKRVPTSFLFLMLIYVGPFGVALATGSEPNDIQEKVKPIERAHVAVDEVRKNFRTALGKALSEKGAQKALGDCKVEAPHVGKNEKGRGMHSLEVGRTSLKLRNSKNAARAWVKPYLEKFSVLAAAEIPKSTLVTLGKNHYGYLEPIIVEPICLNCHGANLTEGVKQDLAAYYPDDKATGFSVGDFRGVIWLEWKNGKN